MSIRSLSGYRIEQAIERAARSRSARKAAATRRRNKLVAMEMAGGYEICSDCPRTILKKSGGLCGYCFSAEKFKLSRKEPR